MSKTSLCKKQHDGRSDYIPCNTTCIICDILNRNGSKIFRSSFSLKYHITKEHDLRDELHSGITKKEVLDVARAVAVALSWNMLIDLPRRSES
jgi:hypothetical protein